MSNLEALKYLHSHSIIDFRNYDNQRALFAPASDFETKPDSMTEKEFEQKRGYLGVENFRLDAVGRNGIMKIFSTQELAELLCETKVADSIEEAMIIIPRLDGQRFEYPDFKGIQFDKTGEDTYRLQTEIRYT